MKELNKLQFSSTEMRPESYVVPGFYLVRFYLDDNNIDVNGKTISLFPQGDLSFYFGNYKVIVPENASLEFKDRLDKHREGNRFSEIWLPVFVELGKDKLPFLLDVCPFSKSLDKEEPLLVYTRPFQWEDISLIERCDEKNSFCVTNAGGSYSHFKYPELTKDEWTCLLLSYFGKSVSFIAGDMNCSESRVKHLRQSICGKLEAPNIESAIVMVNTFRLR
ncbi:MAG: LuxR C-terminal-related transcriptional regulator [Candidatus Cryptobacteroides sp.]